MTWFFRNLVYQNPTRDGDWRIWSIIVMVSTSTEVRKTEDFNKDFSRMRLCIKKTHLELRGEKLRQCEN